jgi:NADPH-dependent 2,4-dienoyl-CoA reductase/sulfur reductase-like enzyme
VPYDKLVLSQGAKAIVPPIPGANLPHVFTLRDIPDMDRIATFLNEGRPRHAVVIGGGFIGMEMAEAFHHRGLHVTIVERNPHILPLLDRDMAAHLQNQIRRDDFDFKSSAEATRFTNDGVEFADGSRLPADLILMSVGVKAEVELARAAGLEIGETGGVKTNGRLESSDPNIYAVGDAAETMHALTGARARIALAGPANRQGRIAWRQCSRRAPDLPRRSRQLHREGSQHDRRVYRSQQRAGEEGGVQLLHQPHARQQSRALLSRREAGAGQNRRRRRHWPSARCAGLG